MQIGEILKEQREAKNISLDDIQAETKIQKRYLVAIEHNDFHALPGKFYARAFIKEYALAVGLNPDEVLEGFNETDLETEESEVQYTRMDRSRRSNATKGSSFWSFLPTAIVIILIIGILFVAWSLYQKKALTPDDNGEEQIENDEIYRNKTENNPDEKPADVANDNSDEGISMDEEAESEGIDEDTFSIVEEGTGGFPESTLDFTYHDDEVEVTFDVSETAYVELKGEDGNNYFVGTLEPGETSETYNVTDEAKLFIKVGNANGITPRINDVALEYPVDTSTVTQKLWVNLKKAE